MKKWRTVLGLFLNLAAIAALAVPLIMHFTSGAAIGDLVSLLPQLPVCGVAFIGLVGLIAFIADFPALAGKKCSRFVAGLKMVSATLGVAILVIGLAYLLPQSGDAAFLTEVNLGLWVYLVGPIAAILSFLIENKPHLRWSAAFGAMFILIIYLGTMVVLGLTNVVPYPYEFLNFTVAEIYLPITWVVSLVLGSLLVAILLIVLHNIGSKDKAIIEDEPEGVAVDVSEPAEEAKPEEAAAEAAEAEAAAPAEEKPAEEAKPEEAKPEESAPEAVEEAPVEEKPAAAKKPARIPPTASKSRTYHITRQPSGNWQVKLAGGSKAIRVFPTQSEAIAFTKGLVESRGGSYRIHSLKGKIRK